MKIYKIISCLLIVASWCCSSHAVSVDDFVEQEFKYMVRQLDKDLTYSVEEIDITKLNLSKDETILWKRTREMEAARALKLRSLEKIMSINYMVASYPADILNPSDTNNIHLKDDTDIFDHQNMAFLCASQGDINCLRIMLDKNVDVNVTNQKGDSLLATAISAGQIDAVRLLLARGARPSSIAFNLALSKNDPSIIQSLKAMDAKF